MVQSIGPIHPDTREAEFKHLKKGSYNIYLEVHVSYRPLSEAEKEDGI